MNGDDDVNEACKMMSRMILCTPLMSWWEPLFVPETHSQMTRSVRSRTTAQKKMGKKVIIKKLITNNEALVIVFRNVLHSHR